MAKRNIPVGLFYASYNSDCTYELNSSLNYRRHAEDYEVLPRNSEALIQIVMIHLLIKRSA